MKKLVSILVALTIAFSTLSFFPSFVTTVKASEIKATQTFVKPTSSTDGFDFAGKQAYLVNGLKEVPHTYSTWIYLPADWNVSSRAGSIISTYSGTTNSPYFHFDLYVANGKTCPRLEWKDLWNTKLSSSLALNFDTVSITPGQWTHLAVTYDFITNKGKCYVNGELKETDSISSASANSQLLDFDDRAVNWPIAVGADLRPSLQYPFVGSLYNMSLYSTPLSGEDIANIYNNGTDFTREDLLAHWDFDKKAGENISDKSNNGTSLTYNKLWIEESGIDTSAYDYSFAFVPDIQYLVENDTEYESGQVNKVYKWIADNVDDYNIQYVAGLGDVTNYDLPSEWQTAYNAISSNLNGVVDYSVINGNHDYGDPLKTVSYTKGSTTITENKMGGNGLDTYFGADATYTAQYTSENNGGTYESEKLANTYKKITVGNNKWLFVNLDWDPTDDVLVWANKLVASNSDHKVIITTHNYLNGDAKVTDAERTGSKVINNNGVDLWNKFASLHSNVKMVVCGHQEYNCVTMAQSKGINGNTVSQFLIDSQSIDAELMNLMDKKDTASTDNDTFAWGENALGVGMVALFHFTEDGSDVAVEYYSVLREKYFYSANQFTFDMDADKNDVNADWGGAGYAPTGSGTKEDPYLISDTAHLLWMASMIEQNDSTSSGSGNASFDGVYFEQVCDINLEGHSIKSIGHYYSPSNNRMTAFAGNYNGNGYKIYNGDIVPMMPDSSGTHSLNRGWADGLFGVIYGATIKNVTLDNVNIYSRGVTGGIVGRAVAVEDGNAPSNFNVIEGCRLTDSVTIYPIIPNKKTLNSDIAFDNHSDFGVVGSIAGIVNGTTIKNCSSEASMSIDGNHNIVGGIVGNAGYNSIVENCYFGGEITLVENTSKIANAFGGIVGNVSPSKITKSNNSSDIFAGTLTVRNCYNAGSFEYTGTFALTVDTYWGGIVGHARSLYDVKKGEYAFLVENCYNLYSKKVEDVMKSSTCYYIGGILGNATATAYEVEGSVYLRNCYSVEVDAMGGEGTNEYRHNDAVTIYGVAGVKAVSNVGTATTDSMAQNVRRILVSIAYAQSGSTQTATWSSGNGVPTFKATPGDMYLDSTTSDVYQYVYGWEFICNAKGEDGKDGTDGTNGTNGVDGVTPSIEINEDGYWVINGVVTEYKAIGKDGTNGTNGVDGVTPSIEINEDGYWVINGVVTEYKAIGEDGVDGLDGRDGAGCAGKVGDILLLVTSLCALAFVSRKF